MNLRDLGRRRPLANICSRVTYFVSNFPLEYKILPLAVPASHPTRPPTYSHPSSSYTPYPQGRPMSLNSSTNTICVNRCWGWGRSRPLGSHGPTGPCAHSLSHTLIARARTQRSITSARSAATAFPTVVNQLPPPCARARAQHHRVRTNARAHERAHSTHRTAPRPRTHPVSPPSHSFDSDH